ncbi:hypothetical protein Tco_1332825, partial [Tanacetum coccineum]
MEKLENENVSLHFKYNLWLKNVKISNWNIKSFLIQYKNTQSQSQMEINELIENVNQKTYAYGDVRAKNQVLLIIISELKAKLKMQKK